MGRGAAPPPPALRQLYTNLMCGVGGRRDHTVPNNLERLLSEHMYGRLMNVYIYAHPTVFSLGDERAELIFVLSSGPRARWPQ